MTNIESHRLIIKRCDKDIFEFLSDFTNFNALMPAQVVGWSSDKDTCSFKIQDFPNIKMRIIDRIPYSNINISSQEDSPIIFNMQCILNKKSDFETEVFIRFNADLPPMIKMMAAKPLKNFVDLLVNQLKIIAENGKF
ncbi:MAG TPA: hypothetical protein P5250_08350 [Bacteroidales bacterium]|nr:hypothetical protein [Bacteroidales bacterium]